MQRCKNIYPASARDCGGLLPCLGRLLAPCDIRLEMGGGRGFRMHGILGRTFHTVLSALHRNYAVNQKNCGAADKKTEKRKIKMFEEIFVHKKINSEKLKTYGFSEQDGEYKFSMEILNGEFQLEIVLGKNGKLDTTLTEKQSGEKYILYKTKATGEFVGNVRSEIGKILAEIAEKCFDTAIFRGEQTVRLIQYASEKYGSEPEFLWEKFSDNAVLRRKDSEKWFAVLLTVSRRKLGMDSDETVEIVDLRTQAENLSALVDGKKFFPGWHMNKKHWFTIILDGSVSFEEICRRIDKSYNLAK